MVEGIEAFDFGAVQTHSPGCIHCALRGWRHVQAEGRICDWRSQDVGESFSTILPNRISNHGNHMAFGDVLAARLGMALTGYFDEDGKVRAMNRDAVESLSHREMQLMAWVSGMLEALES